MKKLFLSLLMAAAIQPVFACQIPEAPDEDNYVQVVLNWGLFQCAGSTVSQEVKYRRIEQLLNAGANPNTEMRNNDVLLRSICSNSDLKIIKLLLVRKAFATQYHLCQAAESGNLELCKLLLGTGSIFINDRDGRGSTALICAAQAADFKKFKKESSESHRAVCKFLLENGADAEAVNDDDKTAFDYVPDLLDLIKK